MVMRCIFCVLSSMVAATLMLSFAYGEETPAATTPPTTTTKTKVVYKEKSYYDFEDVLINGNLRAPDGSFIFRKSQSNFSSALNLHRSFIPELKESSSSAR